MTLSEDQSSGAPPTRILIADGHAFVRARLSVALTSLGFVVCGEAGDAAAVVESAVALEPDMCLLDVAVPGGGIWAAKQIARLCPGTGVIMLTASASPSDLLDSLRVGALGYLPKSSTADTLDVTLRAALHGEVALPREQVANVLRAFRTHDEQRTAPERDGGDSLTRREWEVLELLEQGGSTSEIAERLFLSPVTVRRHIGEALKKLGVPDRHSAVALLGRARAAAAAVDRAPGDSEPEAFNIVNAVSDVRSIDETEKISQPASNAYEVRRRLTVGTKIIAIDDHALFLDAIQRVLRERGLEIVASARNGIDGVRLCKELQPDLVLVDLALPGMDGIETGRQIIEAVPSARVLMVTASSDPDAVRLALKIGFHGFITKNTSLLRFVDAMEMALAGHVVIPQDVARRTAGASTPGEQAAALLIDQLTRRERDVLELLVEGAGSVEIAKRLSVSPNTVRSHVQNILTKLQVHSRLEAAAFAVRHGVVRVTGPRSLAGC